MTKSKSYTFKNSKIRDSPFFSDVQPFYTTHVYFSHKTNYTRNKLWQALSLALIKHFVSSHKNQSHTKQAIAGSASSFVSNHNKPINHTSNKLLQALPLVLFPTSKPINHTPFLQSRCWRLCLWQTVPRDLLGLGLLGSLLWFWSFCEVRAEIHGVAQVGLALAGLRNLF